MGVPRIISVDDHVIEPPNVWSDRLPRRQRDLGPGVPARRDGPEIDFWQYEDLSWCHQMLNAAAGFR